MSSESEQFLGIHDTPSKRSEGTGISLRLRIILYISAWVVALSVTAFANALRLAETAMLLLFPLGLAELVTNGGWGRDSYFYLILGWLFYAFHALVTLMCRRRTWFYALYAVLIGTLIFNTAGCHLVLHSLPRL